MNMDKFISFMTDGFIIEDENEIEKLYEIQAANEDKKRIGFADDWTYIHYGKGDNKIQIMLSKDQKTKKPNMGRHELNSMTEQQILGAGGSDQEICKKGGKKRRRLSKRKRSSKRKKSSRRKPRKGSCRNKRKSRSCKRSKRCSWTKRSKRSKGHCRKSKNRRK